MRQSQGNALNHDQYGVVIDAGSSGSRVYIYKWQDPAYTSKVGDTENLYSVPRISLSKEWTTKTSPGLSSFKKKPNKAFKDHIKPLLQFAEDIIPKENLKSTPVFIQATAGMRLLSDKKRDLILGDLCSGIKHSTNFLLEDCRSQVQVIDGETEGIYGWIGLNYLLKNFDNYNASDELHTSFGFMDMGGGSAQVAYVPNNPREIEKHDDDISSVILRSLNGETQTWRVFVGTWLGFGANEARSRYLAQIVNSLPENTNDRNDDDFLTRELVDPCMLKGSHTKFKFKDKYFHFSGSGNFEHCSKSIFPLLRKDTPCIEEPCLFNGVHAPAIDFYNDKFIGTSEYWYTANDVFQVGGEYNFHDFSQKVKEFCESDWKEVEEHSKNGRYNNIPIKLLLDSCFKANWILSVLHEGFDMPRVGIEITDDQETKDRDTSEGAAASVAFQSTDSIEGYDLSWTLGKMVLYVSGLVEASRGDASVGISPSRNDIKIFGKDFIPGSILGQGLSATESSSLFKQFMKIIVVVVVAIIALMLWTVLFPQKASRVSRLKSFVKYLKSRLSRWWRSDLPRLSSLSSLEEGLFVRTGLESDDRDGNQVRSRSMVSLEDARKLSAEQYSMDSPVSNHSGNKFVRTNLRPAFSLADFSKFAKSAPSDRESGHVNI
ncbi:apyrase [Lachancea thermotolerans CBS 6340]|uniref:KLTH0F13178p n=1 Tax=Lachancea thermotolerans (strain ATCC 56472 / CBS 6340 / NRRL Y-8284) TaxID=559295 RepID=C5DJ36_LACTC|nr:KLTH0F13178p [Lachancea thermotolerans CBS 6340]CAR24325.1 KLTH0F13178p [Lachancea thermotolerans CBS 6340]